MNRNRTVLVVLALLWMMMAGLTLAYWITTTDTKSEVSTGQLRGIIVKDAAERKELITDFTAEAVQEPVRHRIHVKNTGARDMFARVRVTAYWTDEHGRVDKALDPGTIKLLLSESPVWKYDGVQWYYYTDILEAEEVTVEAFMEAWMIEGILDSRYENKKIVIDVEMECLQTEGGAIQDVWGISYGFLGLDEPEVVTAASAPTSVVAFLDPEQGFQYELVEHDLLLAFQKITPGERVIQNVVITNLYEEAVSISLYADCEEEMSEEDEQLLNRLLTEYTTLTITGRHGTIFYDGPVWVEEENGTNPVRIPFGIFAYEEEKGAFVTLTISPKIENEYQDLQGFVNWVFEAQGDHETDGDGPDDTGASDAVRTPDVKQAAEPGNSKVPETGDTVRIMLLLITGGIALLFLFLLKIRK